MCGLGGGGCTPQNDGAGRRLHEAAAAEGGADQGAGEALGGEGRGDPGTAPAAAQMPVRAAGPQPAHRAPHHPRSGHLGRAADLPLLPRPPPGFPQVHQGRKVGTGPPQKPFPSRVAGGGRRWDSASPQHPLPSLGSPEKWHRSCPGGGAGGSAGCIRGSQPPGKSPAGDRITHYRPPPPSLPRSGSPGEGGGGGGGGRGASPGPWEKVCGRAGEVVGPLPESQPGRGALPGGRYSPPPVPDPILLKLKPTLLHPWALPLVATLRRCQAPTERVGVLGGGRVCITPSGGSGSSKWVTLLP